MKYNNNILIKILFFFNFMFFASNCWATTYYVDGASGNDNNNGTSIGTAFKTIGKALPGTLAVGDTVLIKGGIYREHIKMFNKNGTAESPITVKNYDSSEVIIDGSTEVTGWTLDTGNIYKATPGFTVSTVVIDDTPLLPTVTQTNVNASYTDTTVYADVTLEQSQFYQDNSTGILYVWTPDGTSPATHTVGVINQIPDTSDTYDGIYMWDSGYFVFENLTIRFNGARGINNQGSASNHNTYKNLKIMFNGHTGLAIGPYSQLLNSEIAWNFIWNWPRGKFNGGTQGGGWGAGVGIGNDSLAQGNTIYKNGGEGLLTYLNSGNVIFRDNTVYSNWSMNIYVDTAPNSLVERNLIYCAEPDLNEAANNAHPDDTTVIKGMRPIGIGTADEIYGGPNPYQLHDVTIRNNLVINCRRGYNHFPQYAGSGMINIKILNNTIITPDSVAPGTISVGSGDNFLGILLNNAYGANEGNEIKNNIVIARNSKNFALYYQTTEGDPFSSYEMSNNLWFNTESSTPIHWGDGISSAYTYTLAQWQALSGSIHGLGDLSADPLFAGGSNIFDPSYYLPTVTSPIIGTAVVQSGYTTDYNNYSRSIPWTMGALEYGSVYLEDTTAPTVTAFTVPATSASVTITGITLTATDNVGVTGYMITETSTPPTAGAAGWTTFAPTSYTAGSAGTKTLYAWAKDAAGNVSDSLSQLVTINATYTVTYNGNGNTSGTAPTDSSSPYASGATVTVLGNTGSLANTGNTFAGWNTAADGSGTSYTGGATFAIGAANVILYAQWTAVIYIEYSESFGNSNYTDQWDVNSSGTATVTVKKSALNVAIKKPLFGCSYADLTSKQAFSGENLLIETGVLIKGRGELLLRIKKDDKNFVQFGIKGFGLDNIPDFIIGSSENIAYTEKSLSLSAEYAVKKKYKYKTFSIVKTGNEYRAYLNGMYTGGIVTNPLLGDEGLKIELLNGVCPEEKKDAKNYFDYVLVSDAIGVSMPAEYLTLLTPNGGEEIYSGSIYLILWEGPEDSYYSIDYSKDGGIKKWKRLDSGLETKFYTWKLQKVKPGAMYKLRVNAHDNSGTIIDWDESDANFTVQY